MCEPETEKIFLEVRSWGRGAKNPPTGVDITLLFPVRQKKLRIDRGEKGGKHTGGPAEKHGHQPLTRAKLEVLVLTGRGRAGIIIPNPSSKLTFYLHGDNKP